LAAILLAAGCGSSSSSANLPASYKLPPWLSDTRILVPGNGVTNDQCRQAICQHNENTDLIRYNGNIYLVHRTAMSQILGPNSSLHIYRYAGGSFKQVAVLPAPVDRDLRDPEFYIAGGQLYIKALTRLPVTSTRDSNVDTIAIGYHLTDDTGASWEPLGALGPETWSFWRPQSHDGVLYSAAYQDGDLSVVLFSSTDGLTWTRGPLVYGVSADTPVETELVFFPSGTLVALVRMDGTNDELLGSQGRLRTKVCRAQPPYTAFDCSEEIDGERFDGPLALWWNDRLFVIARKHLPGDDMRKRTALYELTGAEAGPTVVREWGELPSAGDTSYAGAVALDGKRTLVSWYSGDLVLDQPWIIGILDASDIWQGTIDFSHLQ
jgi:hypothetical protein